jgi:methylenetetrahydrofolate dehydrogenase (NADP+)/methenyltetrahydrofolate cyclohydrolase
VFERGESLDAVAEAQILVLGAGSPGLISPDMVAAGVVILDAGTSESSGKVVGDADPRCAEKASLFTPVPGGIGPVAVVEIFANLFALQRR